MEGSQRQGTNLQNKAGERELVLTTASGCQDSCINCSLYFWETMLRGNIKGEKQQHLARRFGQSPVQELLKKSPEQTQ